MEKRPLKRPEEVTKTRRFEELASRDEYWTCRRVREHKWSNSALENEQEDANDMT